jgi:hypothetical protein
MGWAAVAAMQQPKKRTAASKTNNFLVMMTAFFAASEADASLNFVAALRFCFVAQLSRRYTARAFIHRKRLTIDQR